MIFFASCQLEHSERSIEAAVRVFFSSHADSATRELALDILNDLDWCLDQLEGMQTHRSVSDMTTNKV